MITGFTGLQSPGDQPENRPAPAHDDPELQAAIDMVDQHDAIRAQIVAARASHERQRRELGMER